MATFQTTMFEDTMFEHTEDTEMAVDAGKFVQNGDDIDIDLDFPENGQQDEMMIEGHNEVEYDLELGDAIVEQDEEMTDESGADDVLDEEIIDAPVDNEPALIEHHDTENPNSHVQHEPIGAFRDIDQPHSINQASASEELHATIPPENQANPSNPETAPTIDPTHAPEQKVEEVEELITWESDDEEDASREKSKAENGSVNEVGVEEAEMIKPTEVLEPSNSDTGNDAVNAHIDHDIALQSNGEDLPATDHVKTAEVASEVGETTDLITYEDEEHEVEKETKDSNQDAIGKPDIQQVKAEGGHSNTEGSAYDITGTADSTLEQLHPIVVRYMDQEMSLFPPTIEEEHTVFFLNERKLAFDTCENLFKAFRDVLGESLAENESLLMECPDMGLEIHEGIPEASTLSIAQLLHLHLGLSHNDGHEQAPPLSISLRHHQDVSSRLNELYALMNDGKGFSALSALRSQTDPGFDQHESTEESSEHLESQLKRDQEPDAQNIPAIAEGYATPKAHSAEGLDDEPDFRSPVTIEKQSLFANGDIQDGKNHTKQEDLGQANSNPSEEPRTNDEDEITYEEEEDYDLHSNETSADDETHEIYETHIDLQNTNLQADNPSLLRENTNHSEHNGELEDQDFAELPPDDDDFDLEEPIEKEFKSGTMDDDSSIEPETNIVPAVPSASQEVRATNQVVDVPEPSDEIDYSDDDVEPSTNSNGQFSKADDVSTKRTLSPKRSLDDAHEFTPESKKLKST